MAIDILNCTTQKPQDLDFVLPGLLAGSVGMLSGPGGTGKSLLALQAAIAVAGGPDTLGLNVSGAGYVHYIALEDPEIIIHQRLWHLRERLTPEAVARLNPPSGTLHISPLCGQAFDVMNDQHQQRVIRYATGARLIVIDTLNRCHGLDENDNGAMSQLTRTLEGLSKETGAAILHLHHTGKAAARSGDDSEHGSRGASALSDNARFVATVRKMTPEEAQAHSCSMLAGDLEAERKRFVKYRVAKANYGGVFNDKWFLQGGGGVLHPVSVIAKTTAGGRSRDAF